MKNKIWIYAGIGLIIFILITSIIVFKLKTNIIKKNKNLKKTNKIAINANLEKYRLENIPEDCRLPEYENNIEWWKKHLSHHKETLYCLDYYK